MEPLPKWIFKAYSKLWMNYKDTDFSREDAIKTLKDEKMISVILSELKKAGWLRLKFHPEDSRKHLYQLISSEEVIAEVAKSE